jgi:hypothetical protein
MCINICIRCIFMSRRISMDLASNKIIAKVLLLGLLLTFLEHNNSSAVSVRIGPS